MGILDIHTHHSSVELGQAILNAFPVDFSPQLGRYYSVGYHPWYLSEDDAEDWSFFSEIAAHPQVLAIGEAGLDKVTGVSFPVQKKAFERQAIMASLLRKPLIIHCVRSYNEIMDSKRSFKPDIPWVIHGFRGKKELARQLTDYGFYLSYGFNYQEEAIRATPLDMLFLETDESKQHIHRLYEQVADCLSLSVSGLTEKIQENINRIFFGDKSCMFE